MRNLVLIVCYDGTDYYGFQSQPGGNTIQDKLEDAIEKLTGERSHLVGSGRTDAGVHARYQVANFRTPSRIPIDRWVLALNSRLPSDIVVQCVYEGSDRFHARHGALSKTYRYTINCNRIPDLFRRRYEFHHPTPLDLQAMREGLGHLIGTHDFSSFTSPLSTKPNHIRTVISARLDLEDGSDIRDQYPVSDHWAKWDAKYGEAKRRGVIQLYITGTGFLYNMVRIIAGTLIQVGEGKRTASDMGDILAAKDRAKAGPTSVPHGLSLWGVDYEELPMNMDD
ncbi:tRNA pseudouridine(38-40) synthase TruA [Cohnella suwonensis]|uniref:tRNA pseudouridine synthase A n=1 Tax=Cohnella suwonensis TaxID=696072 RepID=A0ABW0LVX1_9BACL